MVQFFPDLISDDIFHIRAILDENKTESSVGDEKPYASGEERAVGCIFFYKIRRVTFWVVINIVKMVLNENKKKSTGYHTLAT